MKWRSPWDGHRMRNPRAQAMFVRVYKAGAAGFFHDQGEGEEAAWRGHQFVLKNLEACGLLRTSHTAESPPRLLWHPTFPGLMHLDICQQMLRAVFVVGNAGYEHSEADDTRLEALEALEAVGILRTSEATTPDGDEKRRRWHLTPEGAHHCRELWCPEELRSASAPATSAEMDERQGLARQDYARALARAKMAAALSVAVREAHDHG